MDEEEQQEEQEQPAAGPTVTVPTREGPVTAPLEAATHWDLRIWGQR